MVHFFMVLMPLRRRLCSPGTSIAPLGELHEKGTDKHTHILTSRLQDQSSPRADSVKINTYMFVQDFISNTREVDLANILPLEEGVMQNASKRKKWDI